MKIDYPEEHRLPQLKQLWKEAFGDTDAFLDKFFQTAFAPDRCRCLCVNDRLAAALYWFDCRFAERPIAYLYAIATSKAFRGQGFCRKLMADTQQLLLSLGYSGVILVPGTKSLFSMYANMGYATCCHVNQFTCHSAAAPIALQSITATEYAALRRQFLPEGGVLQENENLQFLEQTSRLYTGDGFLYAEGAELLGNPDAAPGILAALQQESGSFRCPGNDIPFAMYLSFDGGSVPSYFGLAFD